MERNLVVGRLCRRITKMRTYPTIDLPNSPSLLYVIRKHIAVSQDPICNTTQLPYMQYPTKPRHWADTNMDDYLHRRAHLLHQYLLANAGLCPPKK
jgi:hypothetical protein